DPFNGTTNPKAIPGATVEYTITLANGGAVSAAGVTIGDTLPANTTFVANGYNAGVSNVSITVGAGPTTFCNAEAGGTDTNADGCVINAGQLVVGAPALATVATGAGNQVAVRFRVTINWSRDGMDARAAARGPAERGPTVHRRSRDRQVAAQGGANVVRAALSAFLRRALLPSLL